MTTLALGEEIRDFLASLADRVDTDERHGLVIHRVTVGKQVFVVTCQESTPDKVEPAV
jgi:hypothetical protein